MTNDELFNAYPHSKTGEDGGGRSRSDRVDPLSGVGGDGHPGQDNVGLWVKLGLTPLPDGSGYSCGGRRFILVVTTGLDVEFEFDCDPSPAGLEESDLRAGLIALVLLVRSISIRLGTSPHAGTDDYQDVATRAGPITTEPAPEAGPP